ncbi:homeodomain-interacting protein kinase 2-like [Etheostoma spectabile]|uniref:homeodomain-interacting protein kinase 2-like n=1 Tax=Etheostoma spectabile TaxID=54343 RepID=UPI0013AF3F86|nr:homeodomain-interacting protein kinase 2-like [Etheostoma spectabile]
MRGMQPSHLEMSPTKPLYNKTNFQIKQQEVLPTTSGGYRVESFLGEGRFGKVASCLKLQTNEKMALKIVRTDAGIAGKREVAMLKRLRKLDKDKNNLVRLTEYFRYKRHYCLVFEMLDTSLHDLMKERNFKPLCVSEIRGICQQMLMALNALSSIGLVHTDIKPDNVMLVNHKLQPFRVKLIDFGLAATLSKMLPGTIQALGYRAPEVLLGLPLDEAVDMWSLGCILAFMYLGKHLYPTHCEYEVMRVMVQMHGQPRDRLLNNGLYTTNFFSKNKEFSGPKWRLNTQREYTLRTGSTTTCRHGIYNKLNSLHDVARFHPTVRHATEYEDTLAFLSLFKRILHLDHKKRISPSEALGHRFITMRHLPCYTYNFTYVTAARSTLRECGLSKKFSVQFKRFVTSSEALNRDVAPITDSNDSLSADEETAAGPNKGASPVSVTQHSEGVNSSSLDNETYSSFVEVKTRKKYFKRACRFFTRIFKSVCCCRVDVRK